MLAAQKGCAAGVVAAMRSADQCIRLGLGTLMTYPTF
jgi:hypothetical protein